MKEKTLMVVLFLSVVFFSIAGISFAEEEVSGAKKAWRSFLGITRKAPQESPAKAKSKAKPEPQTFSLNELSERELVEEIKDMLEMTPEIEDYVSELKVKTDRKGNIVRVEYKITGVFRDITGLDKRALLRIHNRINSERIRIQTERIRGQLGGRGPASIPSPPKTYAPHPVVQIPRAPTAAHRAPAPPAPVPAPVSRIPAAPPRAPAAPRR